jgi:hypothetical protein
MVIVAVTEAHGSAHPPGHRAGAIIDGESAYLAVHPPRHREGQCPGEDVARGVGGTDEPVRAYLRAVIPAFVEPGYHGCALVTASAEALPRRSGRGSRHRIPRLSTQLVSI